MKHTIVIIATLAATLALTWDRPLTAAPPATTMPAASHAVDPVITEFTKSIEIVPGDDALRQKLKEHHNTAVQLLEWRIDAYRKGVGDVGTVFAAAQEVASTKLELAQNDTERKAVLEQVLAVNKSVESTLEKQWRGGFGSEGSYLHARLAREAAEIELLKFRSASAAPTSRP